VVDETDVRVIELCAMLSVASDLATGIPLEHGLRTAVLVRHLVTDADRVDATAARALLRRA
jgi:hypothetical protein